MSRHGWAALLLVFTMTEAAASVLIARTVSETARQPLSGEPEILRFGVALQPQDRVITGLRGRADIDIDRHGFLEVGPTARLALERVPFASYARDLRTQLRLEEGYLRVVWKDPGLSQEWPIVIDLAGFRVHLTRGEFFFQNRGDRQLLCIAEGAVSVTSVAQTSPVALPAAACYRLLPGVAPIPVAQSDRAFVEVREQRDLTALALRSRLALGPAPGETPPPAPRPLNPQLSFEEAMRASINGDSTPLPQGTEPAPAPSTASAPLPTPYPTYPPGPSAVAGSGEATWGLNLASLSTREAAEALQAQLNQRGYDTVITPAVVRERHWYRVQVLGLPSAAAARTLAERFMADTGLKNVWVVNP